MKKIYKLTVEPITPIHIGTGNTLTPLDYKVENGKYLRFSWNEILDSINQDKIKLNEFMNLTQINDIAKLRDFFHKNVTENNAFLKINSSKEFSNSYSKNIVKNPLESALQVNEIIREGKNAIIPGSSLKGAIRTAILNAELKKEKGSGRFLDRNNEKKLQSQLLGLKDEKYDAKTDPLRNLAISDCSFDYSEISQFVGSVINIHKNPKKQPGIPVYSEFISGKLTNKVQNGKSRILIDKDLFENNHEINKYFSIENIITNCNNFFISAFDKEVQTFYEYETKETQLITDLQNELDKAINTPNTFILRVGRWSQVEFVTIDGIRNPKTPIKKGEKMPFGTSRFVLNYDGQYIPLGWCKCKVEEVSN